MNALKLIWMLAGKDLRIEYRSPLSFLTTLFFGLLILIVFKFAFEPGSSEVQEATAGILWVSLLFPGIIQLNRSFHAEREEGTFYGLSLAPIDRGLIYFGKLVANWTILFLVDCFILGAFMIFYDMAFFAGILWLLLLIVLAGWAFSAVGTLFAAMVSGIGTRDVLLPILLFPIIVPVIIAAVNGTGELGQAESPFFGQWVKLLVGCDVIYSAAAFMVFDYVMGD